MHAEYLIDCMDASRDAGLANVLVTNGHARTQAARDVLDRTDATNVDLKSWDAGWYRSELGGDLPTVRGFIEQAAAAGVHLEVTTLVIPGRNDSEEEMRGISAFLAGLSPDIPLHLSAYRPMYKYSVPPTSEGSLRALARIASEKLRYVYVGNVPGRSDTTCPRCGAVLVRREGYRISLKGLRTREDGTSACGECGEPSPIRPPRGIEPAP